ncbi:MAG TPA: hypothetical protein VIN02_05475 [Sulfurovum sp.]
MGTRGRKKKKDVALNNLNIENNENIHIDYPSKSVSQKSLIWEYKNPQTKKTEIYEYPLSEESALRYWKKQVKVGDNPKAKSMLTRIINGNHQIDKIRFVYDNYPSHTDLIDQLSQSASELCTIKNPPRRSGSAYASSISSLLYFFTSMFDDVNTIEDIDEDKQTILYNEYTKTDSKYFNSAIRSTSKNVLINALEKNHICAEPLKKIIKGKSHSGTKTRLDYPQEVAVQLLAISVSEISSIIKKYKEYKDWQKAYEGKAFDSLENLANAYLSIPENFLKRKTKVGKDNAVRAYQKSYDELCMKIHNISLKHMKQDQLLALAKNGHNIDALDDPFIMSWFLDDIQCNFPFNISSKATADVTMSKYTRWDLKMSLRHFLNDRGARREKDFWSTYQDIFARKYPTADQIIPFVLFWMLQTGSNPEAVVNMKRKEKGVYGTFEAGELSPLGDTPVIRSFKNRGTKNWYWFALNPNEKDGLYTHFKFLKSFLSNLWNEDDKSADKKENWPFWVYYSPLNAQKVTHLSSNNLKSQLNSYIKKHPIIMPDDTILKTIEPSRLRNTFITTADLRGASIEEIQEWIKHSNFDTKFKFYANSPDQRSRNFRAIHAIQENIIEEARNFQGETVHTPLNTSIKNRSISPTFMSGCSNPRNPSYTGAKEIPEAHICVDWDMCLFCPNSRVFIEHLPRICARILQYETYREKMTSDEWENNFGAKRDIAKDALRKWLVDGGSQKDIDIAWESARSGKVILPPIFPAGHMKVPQGDAYVA